MKYVSILILSLGLAGCASAPAVKSPLWCLHPGIMGGTPFEVPEGWYFSRRNGLLHFESSEGTKFTLAGAVCMKVEAK